MRKYSLLGIVALLWLSGCGPEEPFVPAQKLAFEHRNGATGRFFFPETMGSGVALYDADIDGDLDLYAVQGGPLPTDPAAPEARSEARSDAPPNQLFLNQGRGLLEDATNSAGAAADRAYGMGVCAGDLNGDGWSDLLLTNLGPNRVCLATGRAEERYVYGPDLEYEAGSPAGQGEWSTAAGLGDLDRDGQLDAVICTYVAWSQASEPECRSGAIQDYCDVKRYAGLPDHLLRGDGRGGFVEMSSAWGLGQAAERGLGVALCDFDQDGWMDVYIANDTDANRLYLNQLGLGAGFEDITGRCGAAASVDGLLEAGMGVAVADINRDAAPDLLVGNFAGEANSLYLSLGEGLFHESSRSAGIATHSLHPVNFGVSFQDFDGDGWEDLLAVCGHVLRHVDEQVTTWGWAQRDLLLRQDRPGHFEPADLGSYLGQAWSSRGLACGDLDGDLLPDVVSSSSAGPLRVAFNRQVQLGAGRIAVELRDGRAGLSNRQAIGAELCLTLSDGSRQRRYLRAGTSYLSQDSQVSCFALPKGATAMQLEVRWPDGTRSIHAAPALGKLSRIEHPDGLPGGP